MDAPNAEQQIVDFIMDSSCCEHGFHSVDDSHVGDRAYVEAEARRLIRAAVAEAVERCAKIVQHYADLPPDPKARARIIDAIAAIRQRGKEQG